MIEKILKMSQKVYHEHFSVVYTMKLTHFMKQSERNISQCILKGSVEITDIAIPMILLISIITTAETAQLSTLLYINFLSHKNPLRIKDTRGKFNPISRNFPIIPFTTNLFSRNLFKICYDSRLLKFI